MKGLVFDGHVTPTLNVVIIPCRECMSLNSPATESVPVVTAYLDRITYYQDGKYKLIWLGECPTCGVTHCLKPTNYDTILGGGK